MNQTIPSMQLMKTIAWALIAPRPADYPQNIWRDLTPTFPHSIITHPKISNSSGQELSCSVLASVYGTETCVIYLHALGSNRTEGLITLKCLPKQTSLVVFDFSGTGKSKGEYISYGNKEKEDLQIVLCFLRKQYKFKNYVIWGRSMGAVTAMMHSKKYNPMDISYLILDSPFSCFESITKEIIYHRLPNLPSFVMQTLIMLLKFSCRKMQYNPFDIILNQLECRIPAIFIYSQSDTLIDSKHVYRIMQNYQGPYESICIKQDHNQMRSFSIYSSVMQKMRMMKTKKERLKTSMLGKSRGITLTLDPQLKDITHFYNAKIDESLRKTKSHI